MQISNIYTALLVANAVVYTVMFFRSTRAIIENHLQQRVRILMWASAFYTFWMAHDNWTRFVGRIEQHVNGVTPNQSNAQYALFSMLMTTLGVLVLAFALEYSATAGRVAPEYHRREGDPQ